MLGKKAILAEMDAVLDQINSMRHTSKYNDLRDLSDVQLTELVTTLWHTIDRFSLPGSPYQLQRERIITHSGSAAIAWLRLAGVLASFTERLR